MRYDDTVRHRLAKARPDAHDLGAVCPAFRPVPRGAAAHFARRALLIRGLMAGSLDAAEAVVLTRPAVELLGLLVPIDGLTERYLAGRQPAGLDVRAGDFESHRRELLAVVAAMLDRWLGDDPELWLAAVARAGAWRGSFPELIAAVAAALPKAPENTEPGGRAPRWPRGVDASAVLLAMAPPGVVELFVEDCRQNRVSRGIRLVHRLLKQLSRRPLSTPALRWAGYATLARAAGPEPVWALQQERVGRLEQMAEPVRRSMATGDAAPILAAANAAPLVSGVFGTPRGLGAPELESWPYTALIREHVENNWRRRRAVGLLRVRVE